jgi:type IV pilus assembly protein PilV
MPFREVVIMRSSSITLAQRGTSMIEVLVTIVILSFGLLGLVGLQTKLQVSEMEAYQRAQALILLEDMASRIASNRNFAANYVTGTETPLGTGNDCPTISNTSTRQEIDAAEWCNALQGAAETTDAGVNKLGAMIGGRGCVETLANGEYLVTVAWQGMGQLSAPSTGVACGEGLYNGASCANDLCRRTVTTIVRIAALI